MYCNQGSLVCLRVLQNTWLSVHIVCIENQPYVLPCGRLVKQIWPAI